MNQPVIQYYQDQLQRKGFKQDAAQKNAIEHLQRLYNDLQAPRRVKPQQGFFSKLLQRSPSKEALPKGVYMWGGVGRGKSFLMDAFFQSLQGDDKIRIHFHEFMRSIHHRLREIRSLPDPLDKVARDTADKYRVICFDEFHISDIADAMILYRLLDKLFEYGCTFVMTSNYEPNTLYPDGLHRDRLLPAIDLIYEHMEIICVDTGVDYRLRSLENAQLYYQPLGPETDQKLVKLFTDLSGEPPQADVITIENREIAVKGVAKNTVWFDFENLCQTARSMNDYLELASRFETIILSDVPKMSQAMSSPARRFTWLIDVLYDFKVKFIMSAECDAEELYTEGTLANEFTRTVSRIIEMQSKDYLKEVRRKNVDL
ncbi:cell division protein ZapE [Brackiella oedipodis]|uniref:cell division protein ZapE n=1 Tax=Brackiella oedipodis TaxID=124225 RepID=UPI00048A693D|nr:cell division protein ZapE [Brackiella oedipodis]